MAAKHSKSVSKKRPAAEEKQSRTDEQVGLPWPAMIIFVLFCATQIAKEKSPGVPKSAEAISGIEEANRIAALALDKIAEGAKSGVLLSDLDSSLRHFLEEQSATAATLNYGGFLGGFLRKNFATLGIGEAVCSGYERAFGILRKFILPGFPALPLCGFPGHLCASVNDGVCHGVPSERVLQDGDLLKLDVAIISKDGFYGDNCATLIVGGKAAASEKAVRLARVAREALFLGIFAASANNTLGDIGHSIQKHVEAEGFNVITAFSGHGVGHSFHEPPAVHAVGQPGRGHKLTPGQVFTVEPILTEGRDLTTVEEDGWSIKTRDGSLAAQWEHTVVLEDDGSVRLLTVRPGEQLPVRLADETLRQKLFEAASFDKDFAALLEIGARRLLRNWKTLPRLSAEPSPFDFEG
eukprot:TRINITY_DN12092_c0_g1_i1.p1 TRINITY_DN12092_c0_g1~~TRINITY_DN12092_c0_g1_i1.p1  ORF type:complete len:409 (-),score=96.72 TRINITY_DN12092_c0_g1_i1:105-1331(-)